MENSKLPSALVAWDTHCLLCCDAVATSKHSGRIRAFVRAACLCLLAACFDATHPPPESVINAYRCGATSRPPLYLIQSAEPFACAFPWGLCLWEEGNRTLNTSITVETIKWFIHRTNVPLPCKTPANLTAGRDKNYKHINNIMSAFRFYLAPPCLNSEKSANKSFII